MSEVRGRLSRRCLLWLLRLPEHGDAVAPAPLPAGGAQTEARMETKQAAALRRQQREEEESSGAAAALSQQAAAR